MIEEPFHNSVLLRLSKGDPYAFEQLFKAYQPQLVNYFQVFVGDREKARDMAQDLFLSVWKQRATFSEVNSFSSYLFKMARHVVCNYYDHLAVCRKFEDEGRHVSRIGDAEEPDDALFARDLEKLVMESISTLPPKRRRIFMLSRLEGLGNDEIAKELHIDKRTVQNQISLCLNHLKKLFVLLFLFVRAAETVNF